jgi:hypothetical protein
MERESDPNVNQSKEKMGGKGKGEKIGQGRQGNMKMGRQRKAWREGRDGGMEGRNQTTNPAFF